MPKMSYVMRIDDGSSDVCSSDLTGRLGGGMSASRCCVCVFAGMTARLDVSGRKERPSSASVVHPASGKDASRQGISFFICSIHVDDCWNDDRRNPAGRIICDVARTRVVKGKSGSERVDIG